jgi:hypothetical protein
MTNTIFIDYGHLGKRDPNYGTSVRCSVCDAPHKARNLARIQNESDIAHVPLCASCYRAADNGDTYTKNLLIRKYLNAPDLEISEGGEATTEQVLAVAEKQDATEH